MNVTLLRLMLFRHWLACSLVAAAPLVIGGVIGWIYPTYSQERQLARLFNLGNQFIGQGQLDLFSAAGAFTIPFQHPLVLIAYAVLAAVPALALPAGERGRGALDLLLATPLERGTLVRTVALFGLLTALLIGFTGYAGALLGAAMAGESAAIPRPAYGLVATNGAALCLFWSTACLAVSVLARDRAAATLQYGVIVFFALAADVAARLMKHGEWLARCSPYGYLRPARVVAENGSAASGLRDVAVLLAAALVLHGVALVAQSRRKSA